jgi:hypothetical protein
MRLALCLATLLATPAMADEVWTSPMGDVVYEADVNGAAVLSFTQVDGFPATLVIPGLAGNFDNRSTHEAFWIGSGAGDCGVTLSLPGGPEGSLWGRALVSFDRPSFPTSFTLTFGWCFDPLSTSLRAEAR